MKLFLRQVGNTSILIYYSTLNLMSWACKRYTSTSEIETFDSNVKQKVLNDEKR